MNKFIPCLLFCLVSKHSYLSATQITLPKQRSLIDAVEEINLQEVTDLLAQKADRYQQDQYGNTPLMLALSHYYAQEIKEKYKLLSYKTTIMKIIKMLLAGDKNIEITEKFGNTPFMYAAEEAALFESKDLTPLELLIQAGSNINAQDKQGRTALMHVANLGSQFLVQKLIAFGADHHLCNKFGQTAGEQAIFRDKMTRREYNNAVTKGLAERETIRQQNMLRCTEIEEDIIDITVEEEKKHRE